MAQAAMTYPAGSTAERLLDSAERRLRQGGYNGFSFRDLAADVGIKSASVHHHFPTKEALVTRLAERYADRFLAALPDLEGPALIEAYRAAFRQALAPDGEAGGTPDAAPGEIAGAMCLCGLLGAEAAALPPAVVSATRQFFERTIDHLAARLDGPAEARRSRAVQVIGVLEGALIMAHVLDDMAAYDATAACLAEG